MNIAIIKYNAGNVASVMYALDRIGVNYSWTDEEGKYAGLIKSFSRV
jgi:glutamine amidotransferase